MIPLVSICTITYNHVSYIRSAIEGFLMQKTSFPIEIVIHDDASIDGTAEIVKEYAEKYPDLIIAILQKENQWSKGIRPSPNYVWPRARGKYIALCEGDDYWTDPNKLQKQVDFLEKNQDYIICTHRTLLLKDGAFVKDALDLKPTEGTQIDLANGNYLHTLSAVFRIPSAGFPPIVNGIYLGDHFLWLYLTQFGNIKTMDEIMGVYRLNPESIWTGGDKEVKKEKLVQHYCALINYFRNNRKLFLALRNKYVYLCLNNLITFLIIFKFSKAFKYAFLSFRFGISRSHFNYILVKYEQLH